MPRPIRRHSRTSTAALTSLALLLAWVASSCSSPSFQQSSGPAMPTPPPAPIQPPPPPLNVARLLNGNWMATYPGGPLRVVIGLDQMLRGRNYVATLVDGNKNIPPGQVVWKGTTRSERAGHREGRSDLRGAWIHGSAMGGRANNRQRREQFPRRAGRSNLVPRIPGKVHPRRAAADVTGQRLRSHEDRCSEGAPHSVATAFLSSCTRSINQHPGLHDGRSVALRNLRLGLALHRLLEDRRDSLGLLMRTLLLALLEFRHHLLGEQVERRADVLVLVVARLRDEHDLVDAGFLELAQPRANLVGRCRRTSSPSMPGN